MSTNASTADPRASVAERLPRALEAFEAAMSEASLDALWFLHGALEKRQQHLLRGGWTHERSACPLAALALGGPRRHREEMQDAAQISEERLGRHGFRASDFTALWDAGLISPRALLGRVEEHLTRRTLGSAVDRERR